MNHRSNVKGRRTRVWLAILLAAVCVLKIGSDLYTFFVDRGHDYYFNLFRKKRARAGVVLGILVCAAAFLVWVYAKLPLRKRQKVDLCAWGIGNVCLTALAIGGIYVALWRMLLHWHVEREFGLVWVSVSLPGWLMKPSVSLMVGVSLMVAAASSWWLLLRKVRSARGGQA